MRYVKKLASMSALAVTAAATMVTVSSGQAAAAPNFQMPFKCGYTATAATYAEHNPTNSVDFQKDGITGDNVLASLSGTVTRVENEGNESYGKWIEIDHGGGWTTRYAHLSAQSVSEGKEVKRGAKIGEAGGTGGVSGPHLHYEQNYKGSTKKAVLNGKKVPYFAHTSFTSKNCGGGGNPHSPKEVCGNGFSVIDSHKLGKAGKVYLLYNGDNKQNCVTTVKAKSLNKKTSASAVLKVKGGKRASDSGKYQYYAGPAKAKAGKTCVKWGGSLGSKNYTSKFEHCG